MGILATRRFTLQSIVCLSKVALTLAQTQYDEQYDTMSLIVNIIILALVVLTFIGLLYIVYCRPNNPYNTLGS